MKPCVGIWGRLFGHQFVKNTMFSEWSSDWCFRCGMPRNGWPQK